jgi:hypothetical protein
MWFLGRNGGIGVRIVFLQYGSPFLLMDHCPVSLVDLVGLDRGICYHHYIVYGGDGGIE